MPFHDLNNDPRILEISDRLDSIQRRPGTPFDRFGIVPPFDYQVGVPRATNLEVVKETQDVGVTHVALSWVKPMDPNIDHFEVWAKNVSFQADQPYLVANVTDAPATIQLTSDQDTAVVMFLRTFMRNGLSTGLRDSPTATTDITQNPIGAGDIADGSVGDAKLDRITDPIAILNADITNLQATKVTAGTLDVGVLLASNIAATQVAAGTLLAGVILASNIAATQVAAGTLLAGVILASNIAATQINAGTMSAVNISAGTYTLTSGTNTMSIDGTNGFQQSDSATGKTVKIVGGQLQAFDSSPSQKVVLTDSALTFTNNAGSVNYFTITGITSGGSQIEMFESSASRLLLKSWNNFGEIELKNTGSTGEIVIQAKATDNNQDSILIKNSSGTTKIALGIAGAGANGGGTFSSTSGDDISISPGNSAVFIGGDRIITSRGTAVTKPSGTADLTYDANERDLINDLVTAVVALIDRLRATGGQGILAD